MQKLLHPVEEARAMVSLGRTRFYEEVKRGRILIVKVGDKSLVPDTSLVSFAQTLIAEAVKGAAQ